MPRQFLLVALLAILLEQVVCGSISARNIKERIYIPVFEASVAANGTISFPPSTTLPPILRSLVLTPTDANFTVTGPFVPGSASARFINKVLLQIKFDVPLIRIFLNLRRRPGLLSLRGTATYKFTRPFGMRLHRSKLSVSDGIIAATNAVKKSFFPLRRITVIDHAKGAASVGQSLADSSVLVFSARDSNTIWPLFPVAGLDLPLEILVTSSPLGIVYVGWNANSLLRRRAEIPAKRGAFRALTKQEKILARIASAAAGRFLSPGGLRLDFPRIPIGKDNGVKIAQVDGEPIPAFERLVARLDATGPVNIAYQLLHDEEAMDVGLPARGRVNRVVVFGNPAAGTKIMQSAFTAALDLPLRIAVWTEAARTTKISVAYTTLEWIGLRHNVDTPGMLSMALANFAAVAAGTSTS